MSPALAAPALVPLHGELTDLADEPLQGEVSLDVRFVDAENGGASVWSDTFTVDAVDGGFTVQLGSGAELDLALFAANPDLWLELAVDGDVLDRLPLGTMAYAGVAVAAETAERIDGRTVDDVAEILPTEADVQILAAQECLTEAEVLAAVQDRYRELNRPFAWTDLQNMPASIADNGDAGFTTYDQFYQALRGRYDTTPDTLFDDMSLVTVDDAFIPDNLVLGNGTIDATGLRVPAVLTGTKDQGANRLQPYTYEIERILVTDVAPQQSRGVDGTRLARLCGDIDGCRIRLQGREPNTSFGNNHAPTLDARLFVSANGRWRTSTDVAGTDGDGVVQDIVISTSCKLSDAESGTYDNRQDTGPGWRLWNVRADGVRCSLEVFE